MRRIMVDGLLKIELPGHTVRLCGGGQVVFGGDTYTARDSLFGMLQEADELTQGIGSILPGASLTFVPPPDVPALSLNDPAYQGCRIRGWTVEIDPDLGTVTGSEIEIDGIIDVPVLRSPASGRLLEVSWVSAWQRLFSVDEGNLLNSVAHQKVHPGERGLDNTTGVTKSVAWGTNSVRTGG
ncbi:hypothetical protein [Sphingomonas sp. OTU376]|uniref:hypothetical protein n=1 Tax=Sphingomonas sp. OTU376 TaxID=3043863 RepID=UPI00313DE34E